MVPSMQKAARARSVRRVVRGVIAAALAIFVLVPLILVALAVDTAPGLPAQPPPDARTTALSRDLAERAHALVVGDASDGRFSVTSDLVDAALVSLARVAPELRADARLARDRADFAASFGLPRLPVWLNAKIALASSDDGLEIASARIGRLPLPPGIVLPVVRAVGDRVLGGQAATLALSAVGGVDISPTALTLRFDPDPEARAALFARIRAGLRSAADDAGGEAVYVQLWYLTRAVEAGDLPRDGSTLPYLRHVIAQSAEIPGGDPAETIRAGLIALALYCGDGALGPLVGVSARDASRTPCAGTTLDGRDDLKRHFTVSAGIEAARTGRAALGLGELKELLDSTGGGSGFSFDDMAANLAGVRFTQALMAAPPETWPALAATLQDEADVLPPLDDLPSGLSEAEFRNRFGGVDSAEYARLVAEIERRIDALPLHGDPSTD